MKKIISVKKINKVFKTKARDAWVLKDVSLDISEGKFNVIFGPSGCGKSTLLNIILGLERQTTGSVTFLGEEITDLTDDELAIFRKENIGMIYQQSNWVKSLTVMENVALPLLLQGVTKTLAEKKALELLQALRMDEWRDYNPFDLSAGQQQKVAVARCLVTDPTIIAADEPAGNLDHKSSLELIIIFQELVKQGRTVILITHDLENVKYADTVYQMKDGQLVDIIHVNEIASDKLIEKLTTSKIPSSSYDTIDTNALPQLEKTWTGNKGAFILFRLPLFFMTILQLTLMSVLNLFYVIPLLVLQILPFGKGLANTYEGMFASISEKFSFFDLRSHTIKFLDIVRISLKNLLHHTSRGMVTIGGVAIAIGFTSLLLAVGFGLEKLVLDKSASISEVKQIDVIPPVSSKLFLDYNSITAFNENKNVREVLPLINLAAKAEINAAITDLVVYAVDSDYLQKTDTPIVAGAYLPISESIVITPTPSTSSTPYEFANEDYSLDAEDNSPKSIVVNQKFLDVYSLKPLEAIGKQIKLKIIIPPALGGNSTQSEKQSTYTIVGIIDKALSPIIYMRLSDARSFGLTRYSQVKIIAKDETSVPTVRLNIEALGYKTVSVLDTKAQIQSVFTNIRLVLAIVGVVALFVSALGMFNTLTVSLLERTREIGLLKAIGMKSSEVRELFLSESINMGLWGGLFGLAVGYLGSKLLDMGISAYVSSSSDSTYKLIELTYIPLSLVGIIIAGSIVISIISGFYPARRATRISPVEEMRS